MQMSKGVEGAPIQAMSRRRRSCRRVAASVLVVAALAPAAVRASQTPGQKCSVAKIKAAGKKANAALTCYAKSTAKGTPVDQACLTNASAAFLKAFQKAEAKGGCAVVGDAAAIESTVDAFVSAIALALPAVPPLTPTRTITPTGTATRTATPTCSDGVTPMGAEGCDTPTPTCSDSVTAMGAEPCDTATPTVAVSPALTTPP